MMGVRLAASFASCSKRSKLPGSSSCANSRGMPFGRERLRIRLVAADHQPAHFRLVIDQVIGVAHGRHALRRVGDRIGDQVLMLDREGRHAHAGKLADLMPPHAAGIDQQVAGPGALVGLDPRHAVVLDREAGGALADHDLGALVLCALGQRLRDAGGIDVAVARDEDRGAHILRAHQREQLLRLLGREPLHLEIEALRHGHQAAVLHLALLGAGETQRAVFLPVDRLAGFRLQPVIEFDRMLQHARGVARGAELPDQTGRMPGRAVGQAAFFQDHDIALARAGQVIGDRAAEDAAAEDQDLGVTRGGCSLRHVEWLPAALLTARNHTTG